jgi:hypothetical protein
MMLAVYRGDALLWLRRQAESRVPHPLLRNAKLSTVGLRSNRFTALIDRCQPDRAPMPP